MKFTQEYIPSKLNAYAAMHHPTPCYNYIMTNPEKQTSQEVDATTIQQLAVIAHNGVNVSEPRADDWIAIIDYCSYWGLDVPGLPVQGTP